VSSPVTWARTHASATAHTLARDRPVRGWVLVLLAGSLLLAWSLAIGASSAQADDAGRELHGHGIAAPVSSPVSVPESQTDTTGYTPSGDADETAVPTRVIVRVVSNDAKLLQDPVGGARVTIRHAETGAVLAEGRQTGDSGSTETIMRTPHERGATIYEAPGAAKFVDTIDLREPTPVVVTAEGPLDYPASMQQASATLTLIPGQDMTGDGLILTVHGFIVEMLTPGEAAARTEIGDEMQVRARIRMLCGCPTAPGGLWDASRYDMNASLLAEDGRVIEEASMAFTGTTNEYDTTIPIADRDVAPARLRVTVSDPERVNFGSSTIELEE